MNNSKMNTQTTQPKKFVPIYQYREELLDEKLQEAYKELAHYKAVQCRFEHILMFMEDEGLEEAYDEWSVTVDKKSENNSRYKADQDKLYYYDGEKECSMSWKYFHPDE